MKLYSGPLSLFTAKIRIALAEKGVAAEIESVPFGRRNGYEPKHPEVVRHNPKQQVPVLVAGELVLYDSTVILEYLEDRHPDPPLYPRSVDERARCRQLELIADEVYFPNVWTLIREVFYQRDAAQRDADAITDAREAIGRMHAELDRRLVGRDHLCGEFSVADIAFILDITFATWLGVTVDPSLERLVAWMSRVSSRPSVRAEQEAMTKFAANLT